MKIEEIWAALEADYRKEGGGWIVRRVDPNIGWPLNIGINPVGNARAMLLQIKRESLRPRHEWPECVGLNLQAIVFDDREYIVLSLRDPNGADVFSILVEDLALRISGVKTPDEAVHSLFDRLKHWQQFLRIAKVGLSLEQERALWGELYVAESHLVPAMGVAGFVEAWKAPTAAHQDFQFLSGALEIKTTAAKQPQSIRITSERQLDTTGVGALFLHVVAVDEREVASGINTLGRSLPDLVASLRIAMSGYPIVLDQFEDRLIDAGYLDIHASRYAVRRRMLRQESTFEVLAGFPSLVESDLPEGVGDVSYVITLSACVPYSISITKAISSLQQP